VWNKELEIGVYRLPKGLDEEVARFYLEKFSAELTILTEERAAYIGVPPVGPCEQDHCRY
jgi:adenosylhomocysteinase